MSSRLMDESRHLSNNGESLPSRDVVLALAATEAAIALRSVSSSSEARSDYTATSLSNFDTALDMTTKKLTAPPISTAPIDIPIWPTPTMVDMPSVQAGLNMTSRCSSASVGDTTTDEVSSEMKEKRAKQSSNHKKSYVWRHFRHPKKASFLSEDDSIVEEDKAKTECIHCGAILAFNQSGTTTTMLNHLKSRHGNITAVEEEKRREERLINGLTKNKPSKNKNPIKSRKKPILQDSPNIKIKCEGASFFSDVKSEPVPYYNDSASMALNLSTNDRVRLTASHHYLNNNNNTYSNSENFGSHHHHHHNNNNYYGISSGLTLNNNNTLSFTTTTTTTTATNNNNSSNNNNSNNLATHQTGNPEIPSPVSDGQTSGRVSIGTVESCAVMVPSPVSAGSDSTGPRRHKKRKRTASVDSPGLMQCAGPSPSSETASPGAERVTATGRFLSYIVKDLNPPEALDSENFQRLLSGTKTCSSNELRSSVIPTCIQELETQLKSRLQAPDATTAVAVECWDHHGALMASVGTQFLNSSGPSYRMLKTQEYCESVPLSKILSCLSQYNLTKSRFLPIVSNEADTLRDELSIFQPEGVSNTIVLPCFTTVLNAVLNDVVSYCAPLADLAPKLMDYVRPRSYQSEKWLHFYNAAIRLKRETNIRDSEVYSLLSEADVDLLRQLAAVMIQLYEALKQFNEMEPTASAVLPLVHRLLSDVLEVQDTDDRTIVAFKEGVRRGIADHFLNNQEVHNILALATVLDPRHKRCLLLEKDAASRHRTLERLRDRVSEELQAEADDECGVAKRARLDVGELGSDGASTEVSLQIATYLKTEPLSSTASNLEVMAWWRVNQEEFPALARLALRLFVIPANCAPASIFSPAGPMAYRSRRALLQREDMNSLLFLYHNL